MSVLFLGGWHVPFLNTFGMDPNLVAILGIAAFGLKIFAFIFFFMWVRWSIPRFRYDQLMNLGWKVLLPLGILNIVITALEKIYLLN